jgi:hypothetical protein
MQRRPNWSIRKELAKESETDRIVHISEDSFSWDAVKIFGDAEESETNREDPEASLQSSL